MVDCGPAARRRRRGAAAADALRPPEGDGAPPARWSWRSTRSTAATPARRRCSTTVYELFMDLGADEHQIEFPVVYTNAKAGHGDAATWPCPGTDLRPLLDLLVEVTPPPDVRARPPAPAARDQPVGQRVRRPDGGRPDLERDDPHGPARSRSCARRPTTRRARSSPAARSRSPARVTSLQTAHGIERDRHRRGRPGRHRRGGRPARGHDRRHDHRARRPAAAAAPRRRRADAAR